MAQYQISPDRPLSASLPAEERITRFCAGLWVDVRRAGDHGGDGVGDRVLAGVRHRRRHEPASLFWGLMIAQLGIVFVLSARVEQLAASTAALLFIVYSALTGVTMSFVLLAYTGESVATTFVVTAGMFGAMAVYGTTTRRSLAGFGQFLFMGLIGVVLASIVGIFWHSDGAAVRDLVHRRDRLYRPRRLRRAAAEGHGAVDADRPDRLVRDRRRAGALPRLHQPVPVPAAVHGQPARLEIVFQFV